MRRVLLFVAIASAGLGALVAVGGGLAGSAQKEERSPEIPVVAPATSAEASHAPTRLRANDMPGSPRMPGTVEVRPAATIQWTATEERVWQHKVTGEKVALPYFVVYEISGADVEPVKSDSQGTPSMKWRGMHLTVYRELEHLTKDEAETLAAHPETRKKFVLYEIDGKEGTANVDPNLRGDVKSAPAVVHLTKDVHILVVDDGTEIDTSDVVVDVAKKRVLAVRGEAPVTATRPGFLSARGEGLVLDRARETLEISRNVVVDVIGDGAVSGAKKRRQFDLGGTQFKPRRVTTAGPVIITRRGADSAPSYEAELRDRVHVEGEDGSDFTAQLVVLEFERAKDSKGPTEKSGTADPTGPSAPPTPTRVNVGLPGADGKKFDLTKLVAEGEVRGKSLTSAKKRGTEKGTDKGTEKGAERDAAKNAARDRVITFSTDRLTAHFLGSDVGPTQLEGLTTISYVGQLPMQNRSSRARRGLVTATCRDHLSFGPPRDDVAGVVGCDSVADLVGAVEITGSAIQDDKIERLDEKPERLTAERVVLYLRDGDRDPASAARAPDASAARPAEAPHSQDPVLLAFEATGGVVRISGPVLWGRGREMKAFDLDRENGWRLVIVGPGNFEVDEDSTGAGSSREKDEMEPSSGSGEKKPGTPGAEASPPRPRKQWALAHLDARGDVQGFLVQRPGEPPISVSGDTLVYDETLGGEVRGAEERLGVDDRLGDGAAKADRTSRTAVLAYKGKDGRDNLLVAPLLRFSPPGDGLTRLSALNGSHAVVWVEEDTSLKGSREPRSKAPSRSAARTGAGAAQPSARTSGKKPQRTIAVHADERLEATAGTTSAGLASIAVRAVGGPSSASVERRIGGVPSSRIAAATLFATLVEEDVKPVPAAPSKSVTAAPSSPALPGGKPASEKEKGAATAPAAPSAPPEPVRWTVDSESLVIEVAATVSTVSGGLDADEAVGGADMDALRLVDAKGSVVAKSDATAASGSREFRGERLTLRSDGKTMHGRLEGPAGGHAVFSADEGGLAQLIHAPTADFEIVGGDPVSATFAPPVAAVFHTPENDEKTNALVRIDQIVLKSPAGPLTIDLDGHATVLGTDAAPVSVVRRSRAKGEKAFSDPVTLASPRLDLWMSGPLGGKKSEIRRFVAAGKGTWVEATAKDGGVTHATGDSLVFDPKTRRLELSGRDGVKIRNPSFQGSGRSLWIDTKTYEIQFVGVDGSLEGLR